REVGRQSGMRGGSMSRMMAKRGAFEKLSGRARGRFADGNAVLLSTRWRLGQPPDEMAGGSLIGLFLLRTDGHAPDGGPLLARIEGQLYAMAFSDAPRARQAQEQLGAPGATMFYVCAANLAQVIGELRAAGACGFIVDYDAQRATFAHAAAI